MNNKFLRSIRILLAASLLTPALWADDAPEADDYAPYLNPPSRGAALPGEVGEAGEAIFGRVFGVQGSGAEIKYHVFELGNRTPGNAAMRSALVPGWGQAFNQQDVKGALLFATTVGALVGSVVRYNTARHSYDDYKERGQKDGSLYNDYQDQRTQSFILGGVALFLYSYGVIDAYKNAYSSLYTKSSVEVAMGPSDTEIVWKRRF
jgi:hypothetical protein